jgi:hypothetical protein
MTKQGDEYRSKHSVLSINPEDLRKLLAVAYDLREALAAGDKEKLRSLEKSRTLLMTLLEYLILNEDNPNLDTSLIATLLKFLGIDIKKQKHEENERQEEQEEFLSEEEKKHRLRLIFYEVYKILNPERLAGETPLQNFINNVKTRGIEVALKYEGAEVAQQFDSKELERLEAGKGKFVEKLEKEGFKGFGSGI